MGLSLSRLKKCFGATLAFPLELRPLPVAPHKGQGTGWRAPSQLNYAVLGGNPYAYGIEANRPTLEGLVQYMAEQHFIPKAMPLEELFAPVDKALR